MKTESIKPQRKKSSIVDEASGGATFSDLKKNYI